MGLPTGTLLGAYEILSAIGAGGTGVTLMTTNLGAT